MTIRVLSILGLLISCLAVSTTAAAAEPSFSCTISDLWFGNDESGSVNSTEFGQAVGFIDGVAKELTFGASAANAALYGWSNTGIQAFIFARSADFPNKTVDYTGVGSGGTDLADAIKFGHDLIRGSITPLSTQDFKTGSNVANAGGRTDVKQLLVILTDAQVEPGVPAIFFPSQVGTIGDGDIGDGIIAAANNFKNDTTLTDPTLVIVAIDDAVVVPSSPVLVAAASSSELYLEAENYAAIDADEIITVAKTLCPTFNTNIIYTKTLISNPSTPSVPADSTPGVGDTVTFNIEVKNVGTVDAPALQLTDKLPSGLTFVSDERSIGTGPYTSSTGAWDVGTLAANTTVTLKLTATVDNDQAGNTIQNIFIPFNDIDTTGDDLEEAVVVLELPTITKSFAPTSIESGGISTLTLTFGNSNTEVISLKSAFTDSFSTTGITIAAVPNVGGTCTGATATAGSDSITLDSGTTIPVSGSCTVTVDVTSTTIGTETNTVGIGDLVTTAGNNALVASADLTVTLAEPTVAKSFGDTGIAPGGTTTLTITFGNSNSIAATLTSIFTDTLPTGMVVANPANVGGTCTGAVVATPGVDTVSYASGAGIPSGGCTITADVTSSVVGTLTNTIAVGALQTDQGNNLTTASASINVNDDADLVTVKSLNSADSTPDEGTTVSFLLTVTNNGGGDATNVTLTDQLPTGLTLTGNTPSQGDYVPGTGIWTIGTINNGANVTLVLTSTVDSGQGGNTITNSTTAASTPDISDPSTTGDDLTEAVTVANDSDLVTVKSLSSSDSTPDENATVSFLITVTNNGPIQTTNVTLTDLLPAGLTLTSNAPSQGTYIPGTGVWSVGTINNGANATLTLTANVDAGQSGNTITNITTAASTPDQNDLTTVGDDLTEAVIVSNDADLVTVKNLSSSDSTPDENAIVSFLISVTNNGPLPATNVSLTDLVPDGLILTGNVPSQGTYNTVTGVWSIGTINNGSGATLTLTAMVDAGQSGNTITNTATAASTPDQDDPTTDGDDLTEDVVIANDADLVTVKTLSSGNSLPSAGETVSFLITVTNNGPAQTTNASLTDSLPTGLTLTSNTPSPGTTFDSVSGVWSIGTIDNGASVTLTLTSIVDSGQGGQPLVNTTTAASTPDQNDPTTTGDVLTASTLLVNEADLVTVKTLSSNATPAIGDSAIFLITVTNNGVSQATNVTLTDQIPAGLTLTGNSPSQGSYDSGTGVWTLGSLVNGAAATLTLTTTVNADQNGNNITNTTSAATSPDQEDPSTGGDDLTETITITDPMPQIGAALSASADGEIASDGSFDVTYTIVIQNTGDQNLNNLQLLDDLTQPDQLGGAFNGVVSAPVVTLSNTSGNSIAPTSNGTGYDGTNGLLVGNDGVLAVGDSYTVVFAVNVAPNGFNAPATFNALATALGTDPAGTVVSDDTNAGIDPVDNSGGGGVPTLVKSADISLDKKVVLTTDVDGSTTLTPGDQVRFTLSASNAGPDLGRGIEVTDLLTDRYAFISDDGGGTYDATTGIWIVGDIAVGETPTLIIEALVRSSGPISNIAQVSRAFVTDPDSFPNNDDGDQSEDDESASPPNPNLGLASRFGNPIPLRDGDFNIPITFIVENTSIVDIKLIDVQEDLGAVFGAGNVTIVSSPIATGGLTVNAGFDGVTDTALLDVSQSRLSDSSDVTISFVIRVTPTPGQDTYTHNATVSGFSDDQASPSVVIFVDDISTAGSEPDTNGNNNAEEQEPNIINLVIAADSGVALSATPAVPVIPGDGSDPTQFETTLTATIANLGNLALINVGIENNLAQLFPLGFEIVNVPVSSLDTLVINSNFDGDDNSNLLDSDPADRISSRIGVGELATVSLRIRFRPGDVLQFEHQVVLSFDDGQGNVQTRQSSDGTDPLADPSLTVINLTPLGSLGFAQSAGPGRPVVNDNIALEDQVFSTNLTLTIENLGNTRLDNVQINESVISAFPQGGLITINEVSILEGLTALNPGFDGVNDTQLLSGNESLAIGGNAKISIDLQFDLPDNTIVEQFDLSNSASAVTPDSVQASDTSNNGSLTDPNQNGSAGDVNEDTPTPILISSTPIIGLVQQILGEVSQQITLVDAGDLSLRLDERELTYQFTLSLDVVNLGNTALDNVELVNFLTSTFPSLVEQGKVQVSAPRVNSGSLVANAGFDGITDARLLDSVNSSLAVLERANVEFDVQVSIDFNDTAGLEELRRQSFSNTVAVNGTAPDGTRISDISNDATNLDVANDNNVLAVAIDEDGDFDPNEEGENEPTPIVFPAALQGELFEDTNGNGIRDPGELPLFGWTVVIRDGDGNIITTIAVDDDGYYAIPSIPPGLYVAEFTSPSGVVIGSLRGLANSTDVLDLNFAIDPRGVVYDSVSRLPVNNVQLFFVNVATGQRLEDGCLGQGQQGQITGVTLGMPDGEFKFDVFPGVSPNCPNEATVYSIELLVDPALFVNPSLLIPPDGGILSAGNCLIDAVPATARCEVVATQLAPQIGEDTLYFLQFQLAPGDPDIINNHIPLDPIGFGGNILVTKVANKRSANVGGLVPYSVTAENLNNNITLTVTLSDLIPPGFKYIDDSAQLVRAGVDGQLDTADDLVSALAINGQRPLRFGPIDFTANETLAINYILTVGAGVRPGDYTNRVTPLLNDIVIGNTASATVEVIADPIFDLTTIIGKVFNDKNSNGVQDADIDEFGIAGVRLATVGGEIITTDEFGRYHFPGVDAGENARGRNFILKVDPASLPEGVVFTSENPRVLRITPGLMSRINFGVKLPARDLQISRTSEITRQRVIVRLLDKIFTSEPGKTSSRLNDIGFYQLRRLAELVSKQEYHQYIVRITAIDEAQGLRRLTSVKKYLAEETDITSKALRNIRFETIFNSGEQSSNLWMEIDLDKNDSSMAQVLFSLKAYRHYQMFGERDSVKYSEQRVKRRSNETR